MSKYPLLWALLGRWRRYLLLIDQGVGLTLGMIWLVAQVITSRATLSPAATAFFAGIALIIVLQVLAALTVTVSAQDVVLSTSEETRKEIDELRTAVMRLLERLGEVPVDEAIVPHVVSKDG